MRVRSTGLGPTELVTESNHIWLERKGEFLIVHMESDEPVQWHLRTALGKSDVLRIISITIPKLFNGSILWMLIKSLFSLGKKKEPPKY